MATRRQLRARAEQRFTFDDYVQWITSGNLRFPTLGTTFNGSPGEAIGDNFADYVSRIYKRNGIVAAVMGVREAIFSEVRFRFQSIGDDGKPGTLFATPALGPLERPWPNGTTGELAVRMIQDADLAGNFYAVLRGQTVWRRRPDKMVVALDGDPNEDEFVNVEGYLYYPGGVQAGGKFHTYHPGETCHWSPKPDPEATFRGMSWLTPVLREIRSDGAATDHKLEFYGNAATPQMVVKTPESVMTEAQFDEFQRKLNESHTGRGNRHKTLYLAPGADVEVVGANFEQLSFDATQGRDETRIAAQGGVPAVVVGLKESMQGSSLNAGNYSQARRRLADGTMRPLYRSAAAALETIVGVPQGRPARLWYDDSQVAFFREDRKDAAEIQQVKATTIRSLVDAGYEPDSVVAAVDAEDMSLLEHSGLYSVQLQPPGATQPA